MIKRLFFDIETAPNIGFFWNAGYKQNVPYQNIVKERAIICICYKWAGQRKVHFLTWDKNQCDKSMLQKFIEIANESEEMVGHNGDRFDLAWIRTRCIFHRVSMFPDYKTIDTLKFARKSRFNSNRLNYLGKFLGLGEKIHTEFDLWKKIVLENDKRSLDKMVRYCKRDVVLLENVYSLLKNYMPAKTHYGVMVGKDKRSCPECGSERVRKMVRRVSAAGIKKQQYQCQACGKYHTTSN